MCTDENEPVVNTLLAMTVVYDPNKLEVLKKKKEVAQRAANKRFPEEDLHYALKMKNNDTAEVSREPAVIEGWLCAAMMSDER